MTNRVNKWIKAVFQRLRVERGNMCSACGSTEDLEFAHINDTDIKSSGRGRKERYYDIKNNPESYLLLCKPCHKEFDKNPRDENFWLK